MATLWERANDAAGTAWAFAQTAPGLLLIGFVVTLTGLFILHRLFAASLIRKHATRILRSILVETEAKLVSMKGERDAAQAETARMQSDLDRARPDHLLLEDLRVRLRQMKKIWLNVDSLEEDCRVLLEQNPWVLLPDYDIANSEGLLREVALSTVLENDFPGVTDRSDRFTAPPSPSLKVDLSGWVRGGVAFDSERKRAHGTTLQSDRFYLIIELKRPNVEIGREAVEQAHAYAHGLMLMAPDELWGKRIDCLVIGGSVAGDLQGAHLRWGPAQHAAIRIIPVTYRELFGRALIVARTFLPATGADDLVEPVFDEPVASGEASLTGADSEPALALKDVAAEPLAHTNGSAVEPSDVPEPFVPEPLVAEAEETEAHGLSDKHRALQGLLDRFHGRPSERPDA